MANLKQVPRLPYYQWIFPLPPQKAVNPSLPEAVQGHVFNSSLDNKQGQSSCILVC